MNRIYKSIVFSFAGLLAIAVAVTSCSKEATITPSEEAVFQELFSPPIDADPIVKKLFNDYGVWLRTDFKESKEVYNAYLGQDVNNARFPIQKVDEDQRQSALIYMDTFLSKISKEFSKRLMPSEIFFVGSYGHPAYGYQFNVIARNRLAFVWPNDYGNLPITDPNRHYYQNPRLAKEVWNKLSEMISNRLDSEIEGFEKIGKPYDNGAAFIKIRDQYFIDYDLAKRNAGWDAVANEGGYLDPYASFSYRAEFAAWLKLVATESYENIDAWYLADNAMRRAKYNLFVKYMKSEYNWDIQETGNNFVKEMAE